MDSEALIKRAVEGVERYFRSFALSGIIECHRGDIEWIKPIPGAAGPSLVYRVSLDQDSAELAVDSLIPDLKSGAIPSLWYVTPTSTPRNIVDILKSKGFEGGVPADEGEREYGMALDLSTSPRWPEANLGVTVERVRSRTEFERWTHIVNTALHGWAMIDSDHYYPWVLNDAFAFYVGYVGGIPVSTVAAISDGDDASLEFVSTLAQCRRQGAATAVCIEALKSLEANGVRTVTLGSSPEATSLYLKLGFKPCFEKMLLSYKASSPHPSPLPEGEGTASRP